MKGKSTFIPFFNFSFFFSLLSLSHSLLIFLLHPLRIDFQYPFSSPPTLLSSFSLLFLFIFKSFADSSSILFLHLIQSTEHNTFNDTFFPIFLSFSVSTSLIRKNSNNLLLRFHHRSI